MSFGVGFGDIAKFVQVSTQIYKYGFSKANRAPSLYNEFGNEIKGLSTNLKDLQTIVDSLNRNGRLADSAYVDRLVDILGDYNRTLDDCDKFLTAREKFSWESGFVNNVIWGFDIASEVQKLKDRVAFQNIKLMTFLKTLDIGMANQLHINIFRIHRDLAMRIESVQVNIIDEIQRATDQIMNQIRDGTTTDTINASPEGVRTVLQVPLNLQILFDQQIQEQESPNDFDWNHFPLVRGLDAAAFHLNAAQTCAGDGKDYERERQWLALVKSSWMIMRVKNGEEYRDNIALRPTSNFEAQMNAWGLTVSSYVTRLELTIIELAKISFNSEAPEDSLTIELFEANNSMFQPGTKAPEVTPEWELDFSTQITSATLIGPLRNYSQSLKLYRLTAIDLKLVIIDTPNANSSNTSVTNTIIPIDMRRSRLVPLYATSQSSPANSGSGLLNITFQGDRLAFGKSALVFNKKAELFKFQNAITGYQVVGEASGVKLTTFSTSRLLGGNKSEYEGIWQLWRSKKAQNSGNKEGTTIPEAESARSPGGSGSSQDTIMPLPPSPNPNGFTPPVSRQSDRRRDSALTTTTTNTSLGRSQSIFSASPPGRRGSTFTIGTTGSTIALPSGYSTSVVSNTGTIGVILEKPEPSLLVLLVQSESKKGGVHTVYTSLAIEINASTAIDYSACKCRKSSESCLRLVIHYSKSGSLTTFRQDVSKLDDWNLAAMGQDQRKDLEQGDKDKLAWAAIDFATMEDKAVFEKGFKSLRTLLVKETEAYAKMLGILRNQAI